MVGVCIDEDVVGFGGAADKEELFIDELELDCPCDDVVGFGGAVDEEEEEGGFCDALELEARDDVVDLGGAADEDALEVVGLGGTAEDELLVVGFGGAIDDERDELFTPELELGA